MKVYRRGKRGTFWIYFSCRGRIVRESAKTDDRRAAERYLAKRFGEEAAGTSKAGPEITLGETVALWRSRGAHLRPSTNATSPASSGSSCSGAAQPASSRR